MDGRTDLIERVATEKGFKSPDQNSRQASIHKQARHLGVVFVMFVCSALFGDDSSVKKSTGQIQKQQVAKEDGWQVVDGDLFFYTCPRDWVIEEAKGYNGAVLFKQCYKLVASELSFDDGVSVGFRFVPKQIGNAVEKNGHSAADNVLAKVKNEENSRPYKNGVFDGYVVISDNELIIDIIARVPRSDGFFEMVAYAISESKEATSDYYRIINKIVNTFETRNE